MRYGRSEAALEAALEDLCDAIQTPAEAEFLLKLVPGVRAAIDADPNQVESSEDVVPYPLDSLTSDERKAVSYCGPGNDGRVWAYTDGPQGGVAVCELPQRPGLGEFAWGFRGAAPRHLALAILAHYTRDEWLAQALANAFCADHIEQQGKNFSLEGETIEAWLKTPRVARLIFSWSEEGAAFGRESVPHGTAV